MSITRTEKALVTVIMALVLCWAVGLLPGKVAALFLVLVIGAVLVGRAGG
jgi:hypothetical protein